MLRKASAGLGAAVGLMLLGASPVQAANIFDDFARAFFGAPQRPVPVAPLDSSDPLNVTVKPKRQSFPEVSSKPSPPVVQLDPSRDPNWYLKDPTLRRGDIVVTARGVMVYQGRDADFMTKADFSALGGKAGDKGWRGQLQAAAAGGRTFFQDNAPANAAPAGTETASARPSRTLPIETATR
ncbi:hypothetical protein [Bosea sp. (in: a-proteobacteria)]|uniref:hypothetical protein n=1 Tax=Bosea sp. (in: a-proteobacteria) TaxID=1871050 RepID=UPI003B3BA974